MRDVIKLAAFTRCGLINALRPYALGLGNVQKFRFEQLGREANFVWRVGVAQPQRGFVLDGFLDGILVEITILGTCG